MKFESSDQMPPFEFAPITREQLQAYAKASGDLNPVHLDEAVAAKAGFSSVIVHGMLSMALLGDGVRRYFSEKEFNLVRITTRFRKVTFPGDTLTWKGEQKTSPESGDILVHIGLMNQNGELTADGQATLRRL